MATGDHDASTGPTLPAAVQLLLNEYATVRQEGLAAMTSQISTLRYGISGIVVLIGVAVQQHNDEYLGWAITLALVPLVVLFSAVIWMGEYERMGRAGLYVARLEAKINRHLVGGGWTPMEWERWLREGGLTQSRVVGGLHRYLTIAGVFIGFQAASVVMGLHFYWHKHSHDVSAHWLIPLAVAINVGILVTLLGYFRSSYEQLRNFTVDPQEGKPAVRQRLRMRLRLYGLLVAVGFVSAPIYSWPLGVLVVGWLNQDGWLGHVPAYWIGLPVVIWMVLVPLLASRAVMHELLAKRIQHEEELDDDQLEVLGRAGALSQLTDYERGRVHILSSKALNAPSIGRNKNVGLTTDALANEATLPGTLAHELGHRRLHHLHPLALSYLYLWPYMYYDDEVCRLASGENHSKGRGRLNSSARVIWSVAALPGWLAWVVLRSGWRTAEYDADRFACQSGDSETLKLALIRHKGLREVGRPKEWRGRLRAAWEGAKARTEQGRSLGYLPVPNEHPSPERRLARIKRWEWSRSTAPIKLVGPADPSLKAAPEP
jgi:Zn-dependent protease with chaperone function